MRLSQYVKAYRKTADMSQDEFAKRSGLTKGYISQIENEANPRTGKAPVPSLVTLNGIARAMGITLDALLSNVDDINVSLSSNDVSSRADELRNIAINLADSDVESLLVFAHALKNKQNQ